MLFWFGQSTVFEDIDILSGRLAAMHDVIAAPP